MPAKTFHMKDNDILDITGQWVSEGRRLALATVIETWGSSPRPAGSHLVVDSAGHFEGSVSGGCVESAVISSALEVMQSGRGQILEFGISNELAWEVGLACGGRIQVYVEPIETAPCVGGDQRN